MGEALLLGWGIFVGVVYIYFIADYLYYYCRLKEKIRKIYEVFTEE